MCKLGLQSLISPRFRLHYCNDVKRHTLWTSASTFSYCKKMQGVGHILNIMCKLGLQSLIVTRFRLHYCNDVRSPTLQNSASALNCWKKMQGISHILHVIWKLGLQSLISTRFRRYYCIMSKVLPCKLPYLPFAAVKKCKGLSIFCMSYENWAYNR